MKKRLLLTLLITGLILLAAAGWTVQGLRRFGHAFSPQTA